MTEHDIRRAATLWNLVRDSHARLTKMAEGWRADADGRGGMIHEEAEAFRECATDLEQYLATWWQGAEEPPP